MYLRQIAHKSLCVFLVICPYLFVFHVFGFDLAFFESSFSIFVFSVHALSAFVLLFVFSCTPLEIS